MELFPDISMLLLATLIGYTLGAIPVADRISRRRGVNIFTTGTGLAGASNVSKNVGKRSAMVVVLADLAKGALAILAAKYLDVTGPWILIPGAVAILGHWRSVFSRFRGGDGLATLGGVLIAAFLWAGLAAVAVAMLTSLVGQKLPFSSLLSLVAGFITLAALNFAFEVDPAITLGAGGLCAMVLAYALYGHRKRNRSVDWSVTDTEPIAGP